MEMHETLVRYKLIISARSTDEQFHEETNCKNGRKNINFWFHLTRNDELCSLRGIVISQQIVLV
jgi:hypothetical protein